MTGKRVVHTFLIVGVISWLALQAEGQVYNLKALGVGPPTFSYTSNIPAIRINNSGQVVGNGAGGAYFYNGTTVSTPPVANTSALDINNNGMIAMYSWSNGHTILSSPPYTAQTDIGTLPSCVPSSTIATALNDSGNVVGISNVPTSCQQPFIFSHGQMSSLGPSSPLAQWLGINNSNQVVGYYATGSATRAFQLVNGMLADLDPSSAQSYDSEAMAINDAGQFIVNSNELYCTKVTPQHKVITYPCRGQYWFPLLYSGSTITNLGTLGPYGGSASGINRWGDVVGSSQTSAGTSHGFLYLAGSLSDLNSHYILNGRGWTILQVYDINDFGQMVCLAATLSGSQDVVVLTPTLVPVQTITSFTLYPTTVIGGIAGASTSTGTVTLSSPAPAGGTVVLLSSSNPVAQVPSMIRVPQNATTGTFTVTTSIPNGPTNVTISATAGYGLQSASLLVTIIGF